MRIMSSGMTNVGSVRASNEDSFGIFEDINLYVLADGMGGHAAGEVASKMTVDQIKKMISSIRDKERTRTDPPLTNEEMINKAISFANLQVFLAGSQDPALNGMGTTVVGLLSTADESAIGFVGDSRLYLIQGDNIQQLTQDHSMVNDYVQKGLLSPEAAKNHPQKHILSRALGTGSKVEVEVFARKPSPGDIYLLCSDGLSNKLSASEMCDIVSRNQDLDSGCRELVQCAIDAGGEDNITVILVSYEA